MRDPKAAKRFALKQSQAFVDQMEGFALELEDELMNFSDVSYKSFVKSESEIITLFYDCLLYTSCSSAQTSLLPFSSI